MTVRVLHRMTLTAAVSAAGALLLSSTAAADSPPTVTQIPEASASKTLVVFTDDPNLVDPHPLAIESWSRLPAGDQISVRFTTGTPTCYGVHAQVQETADLVAVRLVSGTRADAVDRACIEIAVFGETTVNLGTPVGNRAVVSIT
jgi:hypothetical protein